MASSEVGRSVDMAGDMAGDVAGNVGFGLRQYAMAGGKMGQFMAIGFSPRKTALVLYIKHATGWDERLARLGNCGERAA